MKSFVKALAGGLAMTSMLATVASAKDNAALLSAVGKALEDQLSCLNPPKPGLAIRAMIANGLIGRTKFNADGSPVFTPLGNIYVYGKRVLFVTGWELEGEKPKEPFWRGPGTSPPLFLKVILDATPAEVHYTTHENRKSDGTLEGSFSTFKQTNEYYSHLGTDITCYGG